MKNLFCYEVETSALEMVPGRGQRNWMDATGERFAYRCLPLSMANCSGWELLCPYTIEATWNGGSHRDDITVRALEEGKQLERFVLSHFSYGVLTFHTGWLFRTPPGWALMATGAPNMPKDGIQPLSGLVETEWLPFPFTMNWMFTRPGKVRFEKGEPICFVTPVPHAHLNTIQPVRTTLDSDPDLKKQYEVWKSSRHEFITNLEAGNKETLAKGWQRFYMQGKNAEGQKTEAMHVSKREMKTLRPVAPEDVLE